jgi:hypothetical protein
MPKLLFPSTLALLAANALPLAGVALALGHFPAPDLYWMETAIVGFWTLLAIALQPRDPAD